MSFKETFKVKLRLNNCFKGFTIPTIIRDELGLKNGQIVRVTISTVEDVQ